MSNEWRWAFKYSLTAFTTFYMTLCGFWDHSWSNS